MGTVPDVQEQPISLKQSFLSDIFCGVVETNNLLFFS